MRNLKKFLAVLVVVAMLASSFVTAFAADATISADAKVCADIGMLKGAGDGVTAAYTATTVTRMQVARLLLRLLGQEEAALAFTGTANFADAADTNAEGKAIMAYLKANPALGFVGDGTNFNPNALMNAQQYYKVVLTALGYVQGTDFEYADVFTFAAGKGLTKLTAANNASFTIDNLAAATVEGLKGTTKAGTGTLAAALVAAGKITQAAAEAAGLVAAPTVATKATVTATGAKLLKVTFDAAVDTTKTTFAVAKGTFKVNVASVAFATDKLSATLTLATKMTAGDYKVTATGAATEALTGTVTVKDETVTKITLGSSLVIDRSDADIATTTYKVLNQYDEDMTSIATVTPTSGKGIAAVSASTGVLTLDNNVAGGGTDVDFANTDKVSVTLVNAATGVFASAVLTVADKSQVAEISITKLYNVNGATLQMGMSEPIGNFKLVVEAKDQYGNAMSTPADLDADILVNNSNPAVATVAGAFGTTTIDGTAKTTLALASFPAAGTATIRLISKTTGKMASFDVVVKEALKADVVTLSAPALAVAGESFNVPFTAVDQFGAALTDVTVLNAASRSVTGATSATFVRDYVAGTTNLVVNAGAATAAGTVQLTIVTLTGKIASLTISLQAPAVPTVVSTVNADAGNTSYNPNLAVAATTEINVGNIVVNDQYGRAVDMVNGIMSSTLANKYKFAVTTSDSAPGAVQTLKNSAGVAAVTAYLYDTTSTNPGGKITLEGVAKGATTITVALQMGDGTAVPNSDYTFTSKVVADADITTYAIDDMGKLLANAIGGVSATGHEATVSVTGTTADGTKVVVPSANFTVTLGTADVDVVLSGQTITVNAATALLSATVTEATVPVIVTVVGANGAVVLTKNITITNTPAAVTTLALATGAIGTLEDEKTNTISVAASDIESSAELGTLLNDVMSGTDQYGVDITFTYTYIWSNISNSHTITTLVAGDTLNATVVTSNGKTMVVKIIVK